jgi:hypothetical protein
MAFSNVSVASRADSRLHGDFIPEAIPAFSDIHVAIDPRTDNCQSANYNTRNKRQPYMAHNSASPLQHRSQLATTPRLA